MDLVYHFMKSPLILSDQETPYADIHKKHLQFPVNLCKMGNRAPVRTAYVDTDAIIKFIIVVPGCQ